MKWIPFLFLLLFLTSPLQSVSQSNCGLKNKAFKIGEELQYDVVYNWGLIWIESAYGTFKVGSADFQGKQCYALSGSGGTYEKYDWFFKVRDQFEALVDTETFRPIKFKADILEGNKKDKHTYFF